jgi:glycosyltransferase involved in cell wall biosynthesis
MLSAVIVTLNEADKLEECLESIQDFVDELVVVDLESTDNVREVAKKFGAKLVEHKRVSYVEKIRNFSIEQCKGEWVLILDPDEQLSGKLGTQLKQVVQENKYVAVNIPRKNIFFGSWIAHTNFWPDKHLRFFKKKNIDWPDRIHTYPKLDGEILEVAIIHYGYDSYGDFIKRQLRYSSVEAKNRVAAGEKFSLVQLFWRPVREFLARFIKHQGYLDGVNGVFLVFWLMVYWVLVEIKMLKP